MIASVHIADVGARAALGVLRKAPSPASNPGLGWATGLARPPFVATCSLWESTKALATYAYGHTAPAHPDAIAAGEAKPFHHESAFIRFRPYGSTGGLEGKNALHADWMTPS
jgi:hypothetical protein